MVSSENSLEVLLPLYSNNGTQKFVPAKSGLNQWLAGGRKRNVGEAYFPIPAVIHANCNGFWPNRGTAFELVLPSGLLSRAKVCQSGGKALMTYPNHHLSSWLFQLIDGSMEEVIKRFARSEPYRYQDLLNVGFDCVRIKKIEQLTFFLTAGSIGEYDVWLDQVVNGRPKSS